MPKIVLATCAELPELDDDERLLLIELERRGLDVGALIWDRPEGWDDVELCILRCVWDYHHQRDRFLDWYAALAERVQVWNPLELVRWNTDKTYLRDLQKRGIPTVPTEFFEPKTPVDLKALMGERAWHEVVVKPVISADGFATKRVAADNIDDGQSHIDGLLADRCVMVQPFLQEVFDPGERCLVVIDGLLTHALRKISIFDDAFEDDPPVVEPTEREREFAARVLSGMDGEYLYARIDTIEHEGELLIMELEMTEPSLYYADAPHALSRMADRIEARLQ